MGSISEMAGVTKVAGAVPTVGDVYKAAAARGAMDLMQKVAIMKLAEDPEVAAALEAAAAGEEAPMEEAPLAEGGEEGIDPALTEALLEAYSDAGSTDDEDREALLSSAEALEDEEKAAGLRMPTTRDYVYAILQSAGLAQ